MDEQTIRSATTTHKEEDCQTYLNYKSYECFRNFGAGGSRTRGGKQVPNSICSERENPYFITNYMRSQTTQRPEDLKMLISLEIITLTKEEFCLKIIHINMYIHTNMFTFTLLLEL
jgi:hypothetical protein